MAVTGTRVSVTDAGVLIAQADADGISVTLRNADATNAVDIGGSAVANGSGFSLAAGASVSIDLDPNEAVYGDAAATQTVIVHVLKNRA